MKWSTIGQIGNTSLAKLTILIPLLGSFILYNDTISKAISPKLFNYAQSSTDTHSLHELFIWIHNNSIEFLYFGLLLMGTATFIYQITAPRQIKEKLHPMQYALSSSASNSRVAAEAELIGIISILSNEKVLPNKKHRKDSSQLIVSVFKSIDFTQQEKRTILPHLGREVSHNGSASATLIAQEINKGNHRLLSEIVDKFMSRQVDLYYCSYNCSDAKKSFFKLPIFVAMIFASVLMILPTLATATLIIWR